VGSSPREDIVHIPCLPTETSFDVQCPVCGRGFLLLTPPTLLMVDGSDHRAAQRALMAQHSLCKPWSEAHPHEVFDLAAGDGDPEDALNGLAIANLLPTSFSV
jgi:hypothetical protein